MNADTALYEIRVKNHLAQSWSDWFDGLTIVNVDDGSGEAVLRGPMADQAALHGVLARIRDLNLTLVSVNRVACDAIHSGINQKEN